MNKIKNLSNHNNYGGYDLKSKEIDYWWCFVPDDIKKEFTKELSKIKFLKVKIKPADYDGYSNQNGSLMQLYSENDPEIDCVIS